MHKYNGTITFKLPLLGQQLNSLSVASQLASRLVSALMKVTCYQLELGG